MTDTPLPEPVAWTWRDHTGCDHIDMDEQHALVTAAACGTIPTPLYTERQAREAAEKSATHNQLHAEHEHNEGKRLSLMLKEAEARLEEAIAEAKQWQDAFTHNSSAAAWAIGTKIELEERLAEAGAVKRDDALPNIEELKRMAAQVGMQFIPDPTKSPFAAQACASPPAPHVAEIPEGWVLVPREMTTDMMGAYHHAKRVEKYLPPIWDAVLAAAPSPPLPQHKDENDGA